MYSHYKHPAPGITLRINEHEQNSTIEMMVRDDDIRAFAELTEAQAIKLKYELGFLIGRLKFRRKWYKKNLKYKKKV